MTFGLFNSYINRPFREDTTPETWYHIVPLHALYTVLKHLHRRRVPEYLVRGLPKTSTNQTNVAKLKDKWGLKVLSSVSELCYVNNIPTQYP